ncbi:hypothetical protein MEBOL_006702 [Melittangium boletus DSM 14713]|uniref:Uncharacterized protein n=1 Tax=Melittangium boletus DSM 14713 TaxID=1294270 RepID=A0A250IPN5_9BACT|nr:hypothetical protein MEBOL_006702 [Melittangium boletus DSM 14713]
MAWLRAHTPSRVLSSPLRRQDGSGARKSAWERTGRGASRRHDAPPNQPGGSRRCVLYARPSHPHRAPGWSGRRQWGAVHESQERVGTRRHGQGHQQPGTGFRSGRHAHRTLGPRESARAPGTRSEQVGQAFGERAARAPRIATAEATHMQLELNRAARGGQVGWPSDIGAVRRFAVLFAGGALRSSTFSSHDEHSSRGRPTHDSLHPATGNRVQLAHRGLYASLSLPAVTPACPLANLIWGGSFTRLEHIMCGRATKADQAQNCLDNRFRLQANLS